MYGNNKWIEELNRWRVIRLLIRYCDKINKVLKYTIDNNDSGVFPPHEAVTSCGLLRL